MTKKKRGGRRHRVHVSTAHSTMRERILHTPELPRPSVQSIERSSPPRGGELAERHGLVLADVKHSLVICGVLLVLLIALYLLLG